MKVSFKKLWVLCAEKEMSKAELRKRAGLSSATFTRLRKNEEVKEDWKKYLLEVEIPSHPFPLKMLKGIMELGGEASWKQLHLQDEGWKTLCYPTAPMMLML